MVLCWKGRVHEANYLCCTLVPRVPIEVETDWLIRKGSLLQKQCLLWSQAPLPAAIVAGGQATGSSPCFPETPAPHSCPVPPQCGLTNFWQLLFPLSQASLIIITTHYMYFWSIISSN